MYSIVQERVRECVTYGDTHLKTFDHGICIEERGHAKFLLVTLWDNMGIYGIIGHFNKRLIKT